MYEVYGPDKQLKMQTEHASCLPIEHINEMIKCGYVFKEDGKVISKSQLCVHASHTKCVIVCTTTGCEYATQAAAAKALNIDPAQVSDSIKTGRPRSGYAFVRRYV